MNLGYVAQIGDPATYAAANCRRHVFYSFPRGAATLVGLLSLMASEPTDGAHFDWHEKRFKERKANLVDFTDGSAGPWQDAGGTGSNTTMSLVASTVYRIKVSVTETLANWSVGERIRIVRVASGTNTAWRDVYATIQSIDTTNSVFTILLDAGTTTFTADVASNTNEGNLIQTLGVPMAEGSRSPGSRTPLYPVKPGNFTETIRTPFAFTNEQLAQPMFFDEQGLLRTTRRDAAIDHMIQWENALIFGRRSETSVTDIDGTPSVVRTTGGIKWFLEEWEKANGGSLFTYRPGGAALTANTDDQKRIIQGPSTGIMPYATWRMLEERIFRTTMTSTGEKLLIGGWKACLAVIDYYRSKSPIRISRPFDTEGLKLNFELQSVDTGMGTLHVKSHPRFNDDSVLQDQCLIVDLPNLKLRPMLNYDMFLNEGPNGNGIQDNDFAGRKEEYYTTMGLEVNHPESHMWIEAMSSIAQS